MSAAVSAATKDSLITCRVCNDEASGVHYGVDTCEGCKGFYRRAITTGIGKQCTNNDGLCKIDVNTRNTCQACRYAKCVLVGMDKSAVKLGRRPKKEKALLSPTSRPAARNAPYHQKMGNKVPIEACAPEWLRHAWRLNATPRLPPNLDAQRQQQLAAQQQRQQQMNGGMTNGFGDNRLNGPLAQMCNITESLPYHGHPVKNDIGVSQQQRQNQFPINVKLEQGGSSYTSGAQHSNYQQQLPNYQQRQPVFVQMQRQQQPMNMDVDMKPVKPPGDQHQLLIDTDTHNGQHEQMLSQQPLMMQPQRDVIMTPSSFSSSEDAWSYQLPSESSQPLYQEYSESDEQDDLGLGFISFNTPLENTTGVFEDSPGSDKVFASTPSTPTSEADPYLEDFDGRVRKAAQPETWSDPRIDNASEYVIRAHMNTCKFTLEKLEKVYSSMPSPMPMMEMIKNMLAVANHEPSPQNILEFVYQMMQSPENVKNFAQGDEKKAYMMTQMVTNCSKAEAMTKLKMMMMPMLTGKTMGGGPGADAPPPGMNLKMEEGCGPLGGGPNPDVLARKLGEVKTQYARVSPTESEKSADNLVQSLGNFADTLPLVNEVDTDALFLTYMSSEMKPVLQRVCQFSKRVYSVLFDIIVDY